MTEQIFNLDNTDVKCGEGTNILNNKNKLSSPSLYERTGQAVSGRAGLAAAKLWSCCLAFIVVLTDPGSSSQPWLQLQSEAAAWQQPWTGLGAA